MLPVGKKEGEMADALGSDGEAVEMEEAPADTPGRLLPSQV